MRIYQIYCAIYEKDYDYLREGINGLILGAQNAERVHNQRCKTCMHLSGVDILNLVAGYEGVSQLACKKLSAKTIDLDQAWAAWHNRKKDN